MSYPALTTARLIAFKIRFLDTHIAAWELKRLHTSNSYSLLKLFITRLLDMAAERNALMESIYPKLKAFAQEKGYEFQVGLSVSFHKVWPN